MTPNCARIDAALLLACEETPADQRTLAVFVRTVDPLTEEQTRKLLELGARVPSAPRRNVTATLSPDEVASLSHESRVKSLKRSRRLKLLGEGADRESPNGSN